MKTEIEKFNPCVEAIEYRKQFNTFQEAWEQCPRGDWMLWLAQALEVDIRTLTLAKAMCANTVRHLMKDERSTKAVDVAIQFGKGKATREELKDTYAAAVDAAVAYANATVYATAAADAAACATAAVHTTAAAWAADAATWAAGADAADADAADAKKKTQMETANICREILTGEVYKKLNPI